MKKFLLPVIPLIFAALPLRAHDHIEIGLDAATQTRLAMIAGPTQELATYFPSGESPSYDTQNFTGAAYATILTFSSFDTVSLPPNGALVRLDVVSVSGPEGGSFSFWEVGAASATFSRPSGWTSSPSDAPSFYTSEDGSGYGHIHGRVFTTNKPGDYDVTFRAVDASGAYGSSNNFTIRFTAISPPQLSISVSAGSLSLSFTGRADLVYDVQSSTSLQPGSWSTIDTLDGTGAPMEFTEPLNGRPKIFFRIVEYQ